MLVHPAGEGCIQVVKRVVFGVTDNAVIAITRIHLGLAFFVPEAPVGGLEVSIRNPGIPKSCVIRSTFTGFRIGQIDIPDGL